MRDSSSGVRLGQEHTVRDFCSSFGCSSSIIWVVTAEQIVAIFSTVCLGMLNSKMTTVVAWVSWKMLKDIAFSCS